MHTIGPALTECIFIYMQTIMTYSFSDYFTYSIAILVPAIIFLVFPRDSALGLHFCALPVWANGIQNEEMGQTDLQYHLHITFRQSWKSPQRDIFETHYNIFFWKKWNSIVEIKQIFFGKVAESFSVFSSVDETFYRLMQHSWIKKCFQVIGHYSC